MSKKIFFHWETPLPIVNDDEGLHLCADPLAEPPYKWFEDFCDYKNEFVAMYDAAKRVSTTWADLPEFTAVEVCGVPCLESFEHQVHSFWIQVERDRRLVGSLIERERPSVISLSGIPVDHDRIICCRFDPGLFESTCLQMAKRAGILVESRGERSGGAALDAGGGMLPFWKMAAGALSARMKAPRCHPSVTTGERLVFVSPQALSRLDRFFLLKASRNSVAVASIDVGPHDAVPTTYAMAGRDISFVKRWRCYSTAMNKFKRIPLQAWSGRFTKSGIDYGSIARNAIMGGLRRFLWTECNRLLLLDSCIKKAKPRSLVVLYDHGIFETGSVLLAKRHGVKTITLQHGIGNRSLRGYFPLIAGLFACWGETQRGVLAGQGISASSIRVTGYPAFDDRWENPARPQASIDGKGTGPVRVLVATQGVQASVECYLVLTPTARLIREITALSMPKDRYQITVRLHPTEKIDPALAKGAAKSGISVTQGIPLEKQFGESDVVVTQYSTVGFEALLAGLALVSLNWVSDEELIPFAGEGVAARSRKPDDFQKAIADAIALRDRTAKRRREFLTGYLTGPDAAGRLMELALE
jgi:hypothetical protein